LQIFGHPVSPGISLRCDSNALQARWFFAEQRIVVAEQANFLAEQGIIRRNREFRFTRPRRAQASPRWRFVPCRQNRPGAGAMPTAPIMEAVTVRKATKGAKP
jgi:hypothetical protein